jgi:hypothetical protein
MGECKLDHSVADVEKKLEEQAPFLPADLTEKLRALLQTDLSQAQCNELFHLLKKYDLASAEERQQREEKMAALLG